ncbi:related to Alpha-1,6-mannosyltransferase [Melanopsichium pennsylvanicum]|uniref:Related to Alpha-1,6-mannosyltransferase n=2 Tax=Melanopsichium pennsylvanicum TaxID=63383 RepID=A0AAJ5C542_9BASI|nr:related to Alpha-1,6-mannosyltransferase [Melanopsichium pennsylvanicum 4]SNX84346.1 related to Alpha-1,6-mannosyltransferase [Melanopsichium pennsylvanicum]
MFGFLSSNKGKRRDDRLLPLTDFKIGPFKIASTINTPNSECSYTALTSSTEDPVDTPSSQRRHYAPSLDVFNASLSPPPGYKPPSYYSTLLGAHRKAKSSSRRCKLIASAAILLSCLYLFCYITFRPPNYIVLPPERYVSVLKDTLSNHIPSQSARQALSNQLARIDHPIPAPTSAQVAETTASYPNPQSIVPPTIWSSDGKPAPAAWFTKWSTMGFEPKFLDDVDAEKWVNTHFANTSVKALWDAMPRFILKADLLRYLLLLEEGGTWSDMDTVPLMHRANWTKDAVPLASILPEDKGIFGRATLASTTIHPATRAVSASIEPVRAVIGIENDPNENPDIRNFLERWRILPLRRHRPLQFVQWTLHTAPNHPIMLDVLRRILLATDVYRARTIEAEREAHSDGWGWDEKSIEDKKEQARLREAHIANPWEDVSMSWKWQAGHWRWGWDILSVEEWTGPAVWTDAVVSYLYASAGIRPEDLSMLKQPVQVGDVIIVPSNGFNPAGGNQKGKSRLIHLFRGSWKG